MPGAMGDDTDESTAGDTEPAAATAPSDSEEEDMGNDPSETPTVGQPQTCPVVLQRGGVSGGWQCFVLLYFASLCCALLCFALPCCALLCHVVFVLLCFAWILFGCFALLFVALPCLL